MHANLIGLLFLFLLASIYGEYNNYRHFRAGIDNNSLNILSNIDFLYRKTESSRNSIPSSNTRFQYGRVSTPSSNAEGEGDQDPMPSLNTESESGHYPDRFYQSSDECLYFSTDGKIYSWREAERGCSQDITRLLEDCLDLQPVENGRQLVLNSEKAEIFRSLYRKYHEENLVVHLPSDYNSLARCNDRIDDKWSRYCTSTLNTNSICFETISNNEK
jgi:hypothetical protein